MVSVFGWMMMAVSLIGTAYTLLASLEVRARLGRGTLPDHRPHEAPSSPASADPAPSVTILKPLHGEEPGLFHNLESFCAQDYPGPVQIVFGVQECADPAIRTVRELQQAHPELDISLVVDGRIHGANRKISNLMNMERAIRGEVVVLSDADIRVDCGYLRDVIAPLADPSTGYVTCLYTGRSIGTVWSRLSAMGINYQFLPSVAVGLKLGMADPCLGATVALRRAVLEEIGGFATFADQLADDYDLGRAVRAAGYQAQVARRPVVHVCAERSWGELWGHEARWARTIRTIDPLGFLGAAVTYPLPWALVACALALGPWSLAALLGAACARLHLLRQVDRQAGIGVERLHLLPLRDLLSLVVFSSVFFGNSVSWRGRRFRVGSDGALTPSQEISNVAHLVPSGAFFRRLRRRRRIALSGEARDQVLLVPDLARSAGGLGREQPLDRRPAA